VNPKLEQFLHHASVLAGIDDEAIRFLSDLARAENYADGAVIIAEGEPGNRMFFICAGAVKVVKGHGAPGAVTLAQFGPGNFFGEMSLVESVNRSASVVAAGDVSVCTLKGTDFHRLFQVRPDQYGIVMLNLARDLARRLRALDERYWEISQ
jgi:CRP/FNR family cyclic AMP-dependent transcriptional regulator